MLPGTGVANEKPRLLSSVIRMLGSIRGNQTECCHWMAVSAMASAGCHVGQAGVTNVWSRSFVSRFFQHLITALWWPGLGKKISMALTESPTDKRSIFLHSQKFWINS